MGNAADCCCEESPDKDNVVVAPVHSAEGEVLKEQRLAGLSLQQFQVNEEKLDVLAPTCYEKDMKPSFGKAAAKRDPNSLDGFWVSLTTERAVGVVSGRELHWDPIVYGEQCATALTRTAEGVEMNYEGADHIATYDSATKWLAWSDGDVWTLIPPLDGVWVCGDAGTIECRMRGGVFYLAGSPANVPDAQRPPRLLRFAKEKAGVRVYLGFGSDAKSAQLELEAENDKLGWTSGEVWIRKRQPGLGSHLGTGAHPVGAVVPPLDL
eukprot:TRINITY_DN12076_c0_g1_i1.p1 TRINITY_DN12076_c0_g1~~TRINITY_DN12076_c0_g1_i1.p1  ORF type:complete len:266 (+),score=58.17 TRINITY_DN12076_c0_g1_i1:124-921(+)